MNSPGRKSADSKPSWLGSGRYGVRPAPPGGLALVQDFLNTRAHAEKGPDLLGDAEHARAWAANAIRNWSVLRGKQYPTLTLTCDAGHLRELRDVLDMMLNGSRIKPPRHVVGTASIALGIARQMSWIPTGHGWFWLGSAIMGRPERGDRNVAAYEAVLKPLVPSHLLRQLMEQPRRLPPASGDVGDGTPVKAGVQLK